MSAELTTQWPSDAASDEMPEIYYAGRQGYAMRHGDSFIPLTAESQVKQHLLDAGIERHDINNILCGIRTENHVSHIGPVAGHRVGIYSSPDTGKKFLVTESPRIIEAKAGECAFINQFMAELFGHGVQVDAAVAWVRQARRNVIDGKRRPLPAAVLVGPRKSGKTLFFEIARLALGGRAAPALRALSGATNFNSGTLGAELLLVDDEIAARDYRARTAFSQGIKKHLFASAVEFEGKNRDAITMRPVHAIGIAVNDEPEHLEVLPAIDDSMADKLSLFLCAKATLGGLDDREEIMRHIVRELPAFLHLLDTSNHPEDLQDSRTGVAAWQNSEVLEILRNIAPEEALRELMAQCQPIVEAIRLKGYWDGTAHELENTLLDQPTTQVATRRLIKHNTACGSYLGRLRSSGKADVEDRIVNGTTRWRIRSL
jgi:hypothetical protein